MNPRMVASLFVIAVTIGGGATYYWYERIAPNRMLAGDWKLSEDHKFGPNIGCRIEGRYFDNGTFISIHNESVSEGTYTLKRNGIGFLYEAAVLKVNKKQNCSGKLPSEKYLGFRQTGYLEFNQNGDMFFYCGDSLTKHGRSTPKGRGCIAYFSTSISDIDQWSR